MHVRTHARAQALRHKLHALLDLMWGALHAAWGTGGDDGRWAGAG